MSELVAVKAKTESGSLPRLENGPALIDIEGAGLTERVDPFRVTCRSVQHLAADEVDVVISPALEL